MALLYSNGVMKKNDTLECDSIIGSSFTGKILRDSLIDGIVSITPEITGRAWITGTHQYTLDPTDPWPTGYRISDTWPKTKK
jgi:proline racemase